MNKMPMDTENSSSSVAESSSTATIDTAAESNADSSAETTADPTSNPTPAIKGAALDLGFGTKLEPNNVRLLNTDGTFNVERKGIPGHWGMNGYQIMLALSWPKFIVMVITGYLVVNLLFSSLYILGGVEHLVSNGGATKMENFWDAFFFSAQTLTTVGYGRLAPIGLFTSMIAAIESLLGLMVFALATGILYARFARAKVRLMFSKNILVSPYQDGTGLMFRLANARKNQLIESEVQLSLSMRNAETGKTQFYDLQLERKMIHFFPLSWTIVHPIDRKSPLYGFTLEDFKNRNGEFFIQFKAFDDTFAQTIYLRYSYQFDELIYGAKFAFIFSRQENGKTAIELNRLDEYDLVTIPQAISKVI